MPLVTSQSGGAGVAEVTRIGTPHEKGVPTVEVELKTGPPRYQTIDSVETALVASANTGSNVSVVDIEVDQGGTKQRMGSSAAEAGDSRATLLQPLWQTLPTRNGHVLVVVFKLYGEATGPIAYTEAGLVAIETTAGEASTTMWPGTTVEQVLSDLAAQYRVRGIPAQMVHGLGLWVPGQLKGMTCWGDGFDFGWRQD